MAIIEMNEDRTLLRRTVRELVREKSRVSALRRLRDQKIEAGFDLGLYREMCELGLFGLSIPEAFGGSGLGAIELGLVAEELGRELVSTPFFSSVVLCATLIEIAGQPHQKEQLRAVAEGKALFALAYNERPHHAPEHCTTRAEKQADGYALRGRKTFVFDGHVADTLLVLARTSGQEKARQGLTLFAVPRSAKGVKVERLGMVDSRNAAHVELDEVFASPSDVIGEVDHGLLALEKTLDRAAIVLSAEMLGSAEAAFQMTVDYLKTRKQFGVPIGTFQALKHRASDMYAEIELGRSAIMDALSALDAQRADMPKMASIAKARMSDVFVRVAGEGIQMHGGIGVTDEHDIGLYYKRARVTELILGDGNYHRDRYATLSGY